MEPNWYDGIESKPREELTLIQKIKSDLFFGACVIALSGIGIVCLTSSSVPLLGDYPTEAENRKFNGWRRFLVREK